MNEQLTENPFGNGALESAKDYRTISHDTALAMPLPIFGGYDYLPTDIENQHKVGICTAISLVQNAQKVLGKKFSPDFQYLLQKKYLDNNWIEGSSIFNALKIGKNYGFLPIELFPYITEADRTLSYSDYIAKLQAIPDSEIQRLITLCADKLTGYAQIDVSTPESLSKAILDSKAGILWRVEASSTWWIPSWAKEDINPIRKGTPVSGHAIGSIKFEGHNFREANTWGIAWCDQGQCNMIWDDYRPTEAWIPYYTFTPVIPSLPIHQPLDKNMWFGCSGDDIKRLQHVLEVLPESGWFGPRTYSAVKTFQKNHGIMDTGFCGPITRDLLNKMYF